MSLFSAVLSEQRVWIEFLLAHQVIPGNAALLQNVLNAHPRSAVHSLDCRRQVLADLRFLERVVVTIGNDYSYDYTEIKV